MAIIRTRIVVDIRTVIKRVDRPKFENYIKITMRYLKSCIKRHEAVQ